MRNDEVGGLGRSDGSGSRRSLDGDPVATKNEQVEIELARAPALTILAPERPLELLQGEKQGNRPGGRVISGWSVERDDGVAELWLVDDAHRLGRVKPRDTAQPDAGQCRDRADPCRDCGRGVAHVCPEPDVRPNVPGQGPSPAK